MKRKPRSPDLLRSMAIPAIVPAIALAIAAPPALAGAAHDTKAAMTKHATAAPAHHARMYVDYRATQLIGKTVMSRQNVAMGKITDLVLNMDTGHVRYAVLSLTGAVGPEEGRLYAIPVVKLAPGAKRGDIMLDIPASEWREHKGFHAKHWPDLRDSGYWAEIDRLSGIPAVQPAERYFAFRATELIGKNVQNLGGQHLGTVRDLMIDLSRQKVAYVGLAFAPGSRDTGKLYRFPVTAFSFPEGSNGKYHTGRLVLNAEPAELAKMKSFDQAHWPGVMPWLAPETVASNSVR